MSKRQKRRNAVIQRLGLGADEQRIKRVIKLERKLRHKPSAANRRR